MSGKPGDQSLIPTIHREVGEPTPQKVCFGCHTCTSIISLLPEVKLDVTSYLSHCSHASPPLWAIPSFLRLQSSGHSNGTGKVANTVLFTTHDSSTQETHGLKLDKLQTEMARIKAVPSMKILLIDIFH